MSFTLNAVAQAKGSHSNTGANDSAEPLNTTRSRSRTPGAKGGVSPTSSHHLFSREHVIVPIADCLLGTGRFYVKRFSHSPAQNAPLPSSDGDGVPTITK